MRTALGLLFVTLAVQAADLNIIPRPASAVPGRGAFRLRPNTTLAVASEASDAGRLLSTALALTAAPAAKAKNNSIRLTVDPALDVPNAEGYLLDVTPKRVEIRGRSAAGAFYGAQSLLQLIDPSTRVIPSVRILDVPRFSWRGAMLDPARHFLPKPAILKFIDLLAMQKMNVLHLHLTDDQGWRVEIKRYPRLTQVGSIRKETRAGHELRSQTFDGTPHSGFYTQDDLREIVAYARQRFVTVLPEVEMPGHAQAALAAYPELGNTGQPLEVFTRWGVNPNIFNAEESTIVFLQNVIDELLPIFPGPFFHVGGDEVPFDQWKASPAAQARMKSLGLATEARLHAYFIRRMDQFLVSRGRRLVGWDEILEGGVDPSATVMSWRGSKGGIEAARLGHDVVMAPNTHTYFDYYQSKDPSEPLAIGGFVPLEKVYSFDPVPAEFTPPQAARILGTQGQLWSEYMPTPASVEFMAFPRLTALAEVAWTPAGLKSYPDFQRRLAVYRQRLVALGVNAHP